MTTDRRMKLRTVLPLLVVTGCAADPALPPATTGYLRVSDDLTLYYETSGNGETPIVFVPGWTMSTEFFERQCSHFASSDRFRYYSFDPRSQGRSSRTLEDNNYLQHGKDLHNFLRKLGLKDVVLVGWSYGSLDAYSYVRHAGIGNLRAFVVIDDTPKPLWTEDGDWAEGRVTDFKRNYDVLTRDRLELTTGFAESMVTRTLTQEERDWIVDQSLRTSTDVAALLYLDAMFSDYTAEARMMDGELPVMNFIRQEEGWTKPGEAWLRKNVPNSEVLVLDGHMMFWAQPDAFNAALDAFLSRLESP